MTPATEQKLPSKPSELIRLAIKDLEAVEQMPDYKINMGYWIYNHPEYCSVCLAGSVMVQEFDIKKGMTASKWSTEIIPSHVTTNSYDLNALKALNEFRKGSVQTGCSYMNVQSKINFTIIGQYFHNPVQFKQNMLALAYDLEKEGN